MKYPAFLFVFMLLWAAPAAAETDAQILHLLNRISFGPLPGDIERVRNSGVEAYIDQQLHPESLPQLADLQARLDDLPTLNASMEDIANEYGMNPKDEKALSDEERKALNKRRNIVVEELSEAKILRAIMSPAQLQEVMVDFWFNHFNVFAEKGADKMLIGSYERDAIRPYALGKFRDLLGATAHHPAMLVYLDNWQNTAPNSIVAERAEEKRGKILGINENYAREIMELHTLGVDGGYTQADVTTLAHILTGWGLGEGKNPADRTRFLFEPRRHDFSDQYWLGYPIRGGGAEEVEQVLDILAASPATAKHISYELAQYFVADEPPPSLVDKLTATYQSTHGDIAAILNVLFHSPEFRDGEAKDTRNKFKPPFRFVVSAFRAAGVTPSGDTRMLQGAIAQMGEPLYRCLTPNGYANTNDQWLNSDALLKRVDFSKKLAGFLGDNAAGTIYNTFAGQWSANTLATVRTVPPKLQPALLLSSPEFVSY
ncbi:MAG: DUF1800 domain-containing protein [Alphaproteobacteria bacterium]|nr:DUF1800 domain-containing protein [Alphaproteobacteria bacterium]